MRYRGIVLLNERVYGQALHCNGFLFICFLSIFFISSQGSGEDHYWVVEDVLSSFGIESFGLFVFLMNKAA